ncbi:histidine kinase dimerization/phosphoacceptor domain -containing protein [Flagellimonas maritima]|nr:histidine kinase dimerization/phosphoacceptor domain -containing protein [Allomuricauda aurantiaca]
MKNCTVFLCILITSVCSAQSFDDARHKVDSILSYQNDGNGQAIKVRTLLELIEGYNVMQSDSVLYYAEILFELAEPEDFLQKAEANLELQRYYTERIILDKADKHNREALRLAKKARDSALMFRCEYTRIAIFFRKHEMDSIAIAIKDAEKLIDNAGDELQVAHFYQLKGLYLSNRNNLAKSLEQHLAALDIYKRHGAYRYTATAYDNIGNNYNSEGRFNEALEYYKAGLELNTKYNYPRKIVGSSLNVASTYTDLGEYLKGITLLMDIIPLAQELNANRQLAMIYNNLGYAYGKSGFQKLAIENYYKSLEMRDKLNDREGYVTSAINIAESYILSRDYSIAETFLVKAHATARTFKVYTQIPKILRLTAKIDSARGNYKQALKSFMASSALKDSLDNISDQATLEELRTKFEVREKESRIKELNLLNRANELAKTRSKYRNYTLLAILVCVIAGAMSIYLRLKTKSKLTARLAEKNEQIESSNMELTEKSSQLKDALAEREILIREVHHRVKNNLQLVTSMLNLQGGSSKNTEIQDFLEYSGNRIQAMALVHQTLYDNDDFRTIDFGIYLKNLVQAIYDSFYSKDSNITYDMDCQNLSLDIDTAITLGIIANELVHNAFKHAFTEDSRGHLQIHAYKKGTVLYLKFEDNGKGFSDTPRAESFGLDLVNILIEQLKGTIKSESNKTGTRYLITMQIRNRENG